MRVHTWSSWGQLSGPCLPRPTPRSLWTPSLSPSLSPVIKQKDKLHKLRNGSKRIQTKVLLYESNNLTTNKPSPTSHNPSYLRDTEYIFITYIENISHTYSICSASCLRTTDERFVSCCFFTVWWRHHFPFRFCCFHHEILIGTICAITFVQ